MGAAVAPFADMLASARACYKWKGQRLPSTPSRDL
jgi:hypothetical protein